MSYIGKSLMLKEKKERKKRIPMKKKSKPKKPKNLKLTPIKFARVGIHSKYTTGSGLYAVHWGKGGTDGYGGYNKRFKEFRTRKQATRFKNQLIKKLKKEGYIVDYLYISD